jgi:hypothetical protein
LFCASTNKRLSFAAKTAADREVINVSKSIFTTSQCRLVLFVVAQSTLSVEVLQVLILTKSSPIENIR